MRGCVMLLGLMAVGCQSFGPVRPVTRARIRPMPIAEQLREGSFELEIESPVLTGTFDGLWAAVDGGVRAQLFPDVGGKVLDVQFSPSAITAVTPTGRYRAAAPLDEAEPHLALVVALLLAELTAPVDGARLQGERRAGAEVLLAPALGGGRCAAVLGEDGSIARYHLQLGWIRLAVESDGTFEGRGFRGQLCP